MIRLLTVVLAALLALPLAAEAQKPIKVGMPIPLSGPPALFGEPASKGAQMYVEEINAKGGVLGRKIELIIRDSKADANEAVRFRPPQGFAGVVTVPRHVPTIVKSQHQL